MEATITVDGYMISVFASQGSVVMYIRDSGNCDAVEVALTETQAKIIGLGFMASAEELS